MLYKLIFLLSCFPMLYKLIFLLSCFPMLYKLIFLLSCFPMLYKLIFLFQRSCSPYSVLPCQVLYRVPTDRQLAQISKGIGKEFQQLGLSLGLSHAAVDQIRETYRLNVVDQIFHVLLSWRKQRGNLATFGELERTMLDVGVDTLLALGDIH